MSFKSIDDRQIIQRAALSNSIGSAANSTLDVVFAQIDSVMVNLAGLQNLQNKIIGVNNSGLLSNTLQFTEISTPSTNPSSGELALYPKSDGHFYSLNSFGTEIQVGASSSLPVGSVVNSFLTLTQFQGQAGTGWILADGSHVSGSSYETITGQSSIVASTNSSATVTGATLIFSTPVVTTTANSNSVINPNVLTNIPLNTSIAVGQIVSGAPIPYDTTVTAIDQYTFNLPGTANGYTFTVHSSTVYIFTVTSANATAGAVYTNNSQDFTVTTTISGGTTLTTTGTGDPLASGTLTLVSGTGDATITFSSFAFGGANATSGATYTNNGFTYTVNSTITNGTTLTTISGTGVPSSSGTLTKATGTGDTTITFTSFAYNGHNATAGATYTNNGQTFTVVNTIVDDVTLVCTGTGFPNSSGTLTYSSGTGDATIAFSSVDLSVVMSQNATATDTGTTVIFSTYAATTTGNLTHLMNTITDIASTVGLATGQIISSPYFTANTTVSTLTITSVPDCRGMFIRGTGTNAAQTLENGGYPSGASLGGYQQDEFSSHTHPVASSNGLGNQNLNVAGGVMGETAGTSQAYITTSTGIPGNGQILQSTGGAETRPVSVSANIFIRIN